MHGHDARPAARQNVLTEFVEVRYDRVLRSSIVQFDISVISISLEGTWVLWQAGSTYIIMYVCFGMGFIDSVVYALPATECGFLPFYLTTM